MLPDLESLECFVAATRFASFRAAAESVSLTPAALGKRIQKLELQLGKALFHRTTRRVEPTEVALALAPRAEAVLAAARECVRVARGETEHPALEIVLGTRHELGLTWLVPALEQVRERLPFATVHLYFGSGPDLETRVRVAKLDCAVTSRAISSPEITGERLHREDYVFVAHPKLLKKVPLSRRNQSIFHTLIDAAPELPLFRYFRDAPRGGRLRFGHVRSIGTTAAIRLLVLERKGVAVLPHFLVERDLARGRLVRVFADVPLQHDYFHLIFRSDDPRRAVFQELARALLGIPLS